MLTFLEGRRWHAITTMTRCVLPVMKAATLVVALLLFALGVLLVVPC